MNKINGYTEEEAKSLVEYIWAGKRAGKTLSALFSSYGQKSGRAKGSVRNYYYSLMKKKGDERVEKMLKGKGLSVETIREFSEAETRDAIERILKEKSKGISVRRAICNISQGDEKLMLRLQNKYRNVLKKEPYLIEEISKKLGLRENRNFLQRRLESEINSLYERLTESLKKENKRLLEENLSLKRENNRLKLMFVK